MRVTVREVAAVVGGSVIGEAERVLTGISSLTEAAPGDISFLANPKYASFLSETKASAVLIAQPIDAPLGNPQQLAQIVVANPDWAFARVVAAFGPRAEPPPKGIHPTAIIGERVVIGADPAIGPFVVVGDGAVIGANAVIHPHVYIGNDCAIGDDVQIYPQVSIRERCRVGSRVILHSGVVIGSDGFGYATVEGVHHKIPQVGIVVVEDDVEIGANAAIDRARFGRTRIGRGTKIDNLVQIAHNVETGSHCIVVAQVGVAGSTRLGSHVTLAGQCGISGHITIGDQATVTAQSGVSKSVPAKTVVRGSPAQEIKLAQSQEIAVRRLHGTVATMKELQTRIAELERRLERLERDPGAARGGEGAGG